MIISFSTIPGYVAYRNNIKGSWFVQCFCKVTENQLFVYQTKGPSKQDTNPDWIRIQLGL
jgi:hypothetical protein